MVATQTQSSNPQNGSADSSAYAEAYRVWGDFYQRFAEESLDLFQKNLENAQKLFPTPLNPDFQESWQGQYQDMMKQWEDQGFTMTPEGYQKLYGFWLDSWSKSLDSYMRTPEFVEQSGKGLEAFSDIKSRFGEMMEEYWHTMHLPSMRDMRELYHKLYLTERKLDEHERKLDELLELLRTMSKAKPATAPAPTPAKTPIAETEPTAAIARPANSVTAQKAQAAPPKTVSKTTPAKPTARKPAPKKPTKK